MKTAARSRSILHVDLDPFLVSVERSLDPSLRDKPVVVGGGSDGMGVVAAASVEARSAGVRAGQTIAAARRACPELIVRPGDLDAYARISEQVTAVLLSVSRRVERPSADEAYVDLTPETPTAPSAVNVAESIKDEIQRRLGLDASLGVAGSRLAARVASSLARPRGLLIVLPGYEESFLARQPVGALPDLPPHLDKALQAAGLVTLGDVASADEAALQAAAGRAAGRLREAARGAGDPPIPVAAPPAWIQEEAVIRDRRTDATALREMIEGLALRAARRLRPFGLRAGHVSIEVVKASSADRRAQPVEPGVSDEGALARLALELSAPLLEPAAAVRGVRLRLNRLAPPSRQAPLFPDAPDAPAPRRHGLA